MENLRKRRYVSMNTSSEEADLGGMCSIEFFMAGKDGYRQLNGNRVPEPWPYYTETVSEDVRNIVAKWKPNIQRLLQENSIESGPVSIDGILPHPTLWGDNKAKPTLIINTKSDNNHLWRNVATEIYLLIKHDADQAGEDISIEIRNPFLTFTDISTAIRRGMPSYDAFKGLGLQIEHAILDYCPQDSISTISYEMRGPESGGESRPTVVVRVRPGKRYWWDEAEKKVLAVLIAGEDEFPGVIIGVEFIVGEIIWTTPMTGKSVNPLTYPNLTPIPKNGVSLSSRLSPGNAGSVGVWLWYTPKGSSQKQRVILTCFHIIRNGVCGEDENETKLLREHNDKEGIALGGKPPNCTILIDYPAGMDAAKTLERFDSRPAATYPTQTETRRLIGKFTTGMGFGRILHASGRRQSPSGGTLDWAIVGLNPTARGEFGEDSPQNRPPAREFSGAERKNDTVDYTAVPSEIVSAMGVLLDNKGSEAWALKVGRTTGVTLGELSDLETWAEWRNEEDGTPRQHSKELKITAFQLTQRFAQPGDTGAMILNSKKEFVGMLIGTDWDGWCGYMTPAKVIFDDIEAQTGGKITL